MASTGLRPNKDAGSGPPSVARIIQHGEGELFMYQHYVPDREIILPVKEGTKHAHPLSSFLSNLIDVSRPVESFI